MKKFPNEVAKELLNRKYRNRVMPNKTIEILEKEYDKDMDSELDSIVKEYSKIIELDEDSWNGF